jgi:hypothetical protein
MVNKHYIAMSGSHGCLPDNVELHDTLNSAVDSMVSLFELGNGRRATLKREMYLELNNTRDGAEYCEIEECDCSNPQEHGE